MIDPDHDFRAIRLPRRRRCLVEPYVVGCVIVIPGGLGNADAGAGGGDVVFLNRKGIGTGAIAPMATPEDGGIGCRSAVGGLIKVRGGEREAGSAYRGALFQARIPLVVLEDIRAAVDRNSPVLRTCRLRRRGSRQPYESAADSERNRQHRKSG